MKYLDRLDFLNDTSILESFEAFVQNYFPHVQGSGEILGPNALVICMLDPIIYKKFVFCERIDTGH
jgi:hypothetical protein